MYKRLNVNLLFYFDVQRDHINLINMKASNNWTDEIEELIIELVHKMHHTGLDMDVLEKYISEIREIMHKVRKSDNKKAFRKNLNAVKKVLDSEEVKKTMLSSQILTKICFEMIKENSLTDLN